jgi:hypothetical protein
MLDKESRKLGLRNHRELRISAADVPFPVRVFRGVRCCESKRGGDQTHTITRKKMMKPLVAGVEYFSGREPGGGCRFMVGRGRPLDIAGSTATASPTRAFNDEFSAQQRG